MRDRSLSLWERVRVRAPGRTLLLHLRLKLLHPHQQLKHAENKHPQLLPAGHLRAVFRQAVFQHHHLQGVHKRRENQRHVNENVHRARERMHQIQNQNAQTPSISKRPRLISTDIGSSLCLTVIQTICNLTGDLFAVQIPVRGHRRQTVLHFAFYID